MASIDNAEGEWSRKSKELRVKIVIMFQIAIFFIYPCYKQCATYSILWKKIVKKMRILITDNFEKLFDRRFRAFKIAKYSSSPQCIPFCGNHSFQWKPLFGVRHGAYWNNRRINLLIVYTWPLRAVIKDVFLKIFVYEHGKLAYILFIYTLFTTVTIKR